MCIQRADTKETATISRNFAAKPKYLAKKKKLSINSSSMTKSLWQNSMLHDTGLCAEIERIDNG
jgi:hypothetical protein